MIGLRLFFVPLKENGPRGSAIGRMSAAGRNAVTPNPTAMMAMKIKTAPIAAVI